jgi:hypothetical protein
MRRKTDPSQARLRGATVGMAASCSGRPAWLDAGARAAGLLIRVNFMTLSEERRSPHESSITVLAMGPIYNFRSAMKRSAAKMSLAIEATFEAVAFGVVWDRSACPGGGACLPIEGLGETASPQADSFD